MFAGQDNILSTIIPQQSSNYNEKNVEIDREQVSSGLDSDSGCSPPRIKKKTRKNQKVSESVWQQNDPESNDTSKRTGGNFRSRRSAQFEIALRNAITSKVSIRLTAHYSTNNLTRVYELNSKSLGGSLSYKVTISKEVTCSCEFFSRHNTPCKHIVWIMINEFNQNTSCDLIQQIYFTDDELNGLLSGTCHHCNNT